MSETVLLGIYVVVMLVGALIFLFMAQNPRNVPREEYLIAIFIPVWSGLAYLGMALGQGRVEVDGQTTYYARYLDWIVTTPLLLLALSFTAMYKERKDFILIGGLIGADVIMIVTGLIADLSETPIRYIWYGVGSVALVVIFYLVWGPLRAKANANSEPRIGSIFTRLAVFLSISWIGYPLTWLIGPSGIDLVSQQVDTLLFVVLPILSKVGFSLYGLSMLRSLDSASTIASSQRVTSAG